MSTKTPAADRSHGGPGSSHENADKAEKPGPTGHRQSSGGHHNEAPTPGSPTNSNRSEQSGGGGERDKHHSHDPHTKS